MFGFFSGFQRQETLKKVGVVRVVIGLREILQRVFLRCNTGLIGFHGLGFCYRSWAVRKFSFAGKIHEGPAERCMMSLQCVSHQTSCEFCRSGRACLRVEGFRSSSGGFGFGFGFN